MRLRNLGLAAMAAAWAPQAALAQAAPAKPAAPAKAAKPEGKTIEGITVTGAGSEVRTSIDRRSYSIGKDLQAASGSIGDALRNVPSVEVDLQGNLTLRGEANVTIMIDGRPAGVFNGAGRADALQQLPADQIERVEVITTPSAAENPEGSGGIINLITKKSQGGGKTGSVFVTAGSAGLKRAGGTFGYNTKKLAVTGSVSMAEQQNKSIGEEQRSAIVPATGQILATQTDIIYRNTAVIPTARLSLSYTVDPKTQLSGSVDLSRQTQDGRPFNRFETGPANAAPTSAFSRQGARDAVFDSLGLATGLRHSFKGEGHQLSIDLSYNRFRSTDHTLSTTLSQPAAALPFDRAEGNGVQKRSELKMAYARPLPGSAKLRTGYELRYDDNEHDDLTARGASPRTLVTDLGFTDRLLFKQTVNSVYGTYERPFADLTLQGGLRLEHVERKLDLVTTHLVKTVDYSRAYPSLHFDYKLDDGKKLSGGYSVRVQRPPEQLLNPFRIFADPKNQQQGNPDLKPSETQSFELAYELRKGQTLYLATAYYRRNKNEFSPVFRDLGGNVFLTTFDNLGDSRSAGVELVANGRLSKTITYNASTNLYWTQIDSGVPSYGGERSASGIGGRANLNWQVRPNDLVQVNAFAQGPRLAAQGSTSAVYSLNLGWRHKINDRVTATVTAQDLFDTNRFTRQLDTTTLQDHLEGHPLSRSISLRLDYRFGGGPARGQRDPGFEYESAAPAAPQ